MYSSIDLVMAKIERQVRRYKEKIRNHKPHGGPSTSVRESHPLRVVEPPARPPAPAGGQRPRRPRRAAHDFKIIKVEQFTAAADASRRRSCR